MPVYGLRPDDVVVDAAGNVQSGATLTLHATQADAEAGTSALATVTTAAGRWTADVDVAPVWVRTPNGAVYQIEDFAAKADVSYVDAQLAGKLDTTEANSTYAKAGQVLRVPTVDDVLPEFFVIGHRGAANLFPENSIEGMQGALTMGVDVIEAGDLYRLADSGLVVMHDSTMTRTTNGTGSTPLFNTPGIKRLKLDAGSWFGGGWGDLGIPTFDDALVTLAGHALINVEVKDAGAAGTAAATAIIERAQRLGIERSVIAASSGVSVLQQFSEAGLPSMYNVFTMTGIATVPTLVAAGVEFAAVDLALVRNGTATAWIAEAQAAGIKVAGFTADHQADYDTAVAAGLDGVYSNDPLYATRRYDDYRKTASSWHLTGTWGHGMIVSGTGPFTPTQRGSFVGPSGAYRWLLPNYQFAIPGEVCPVANPAGTYSVTFTMVVEQVPTNSAHGGQVSVCAPDDKLTNLSGNMPSTYTIKARGSGAINAWIMNASGGASGVASLSTTAWSIPVLSAGLSSGVAVTSLPVNALTVALKAGHQFVLPTGQVATVSGAAAVGATAIPVNSITPSAAVASGASLLPQITLRVDVSPTGVSWQRVDEPSAGTASTTDTQNRGGYVILHNAIDAGAGNVSFSSVTVS